MPNSVPPDRRRRLRRQPIWICTPTAGHAAILQFHDRQDGAAGRHGLESHPLRPRAGHADIAAGVHDALRPRFAAEPRYRLVDGISLGDAPEIRPEPPMQPDPVGAENFDVPPGPAGIRHRLGRRRWQDAASHKFGPHRHVEDAPGLSGKLQGAGEDLDGTRIERYRFPGRGMVEPGQVAVRPVKAHQALDGGDLFEGLLDGRMRLGFRQAFDADRHQRSEQRAGAANGAERHHRSPETSPRRL